MNQEIEVLRAYLPESVLYIMTLISVKSTLILVKQYGGSHIEIPNKAKSSHTLANLIGMNDLAALCHVYGGSYLDLPRCIRLMSLSRDIEILQDYNAGLSRPKMAIKHQLTERSIRKILMRLKNEEKQGRIDQIKAAITVLL
ncbi:Mor transcription activator family protein [Methylovulum psychrotolerans]|uniref:Mor transcription activator domain-containing protein n=1 Tax=Methylovulum psychrotolerans TaxID=1704499 RepID=A0A2S5CLI8_9GAMM|nr:Mor transcription activator family protein [Methylovulum psychrotolerans]POZ51683.1 hypothetical protein AADEFJLK_02553 [Methylovulum psychrotolerans]